jgi:hypothetical protein
MSNQKAEPSGYNPMGWNCEKKGCFNIKRRPKIEVFAECFPGKINFGDVDGIVEINGKALMLEWKTEQGEIRTGQKIMYQRITKNKEITVLCIIGNAETMECQRYCLFFNGKQTEFKECCLNSIKEKIRRWVNFAKQVKQ